MTELLRNTGLAVGVCALVAAFPGALELMLVTLGLVRRGRRAGVAAWEEDVRLAVVVPAHNESALIARCVTSLRASAARGGGGCAIVVVADNCEDDTAERAGGAGARVLVRHDSSLRGKGHALRAAFDQLLADGFNAFLVVDADSTVSSNLVSEVRLALSTGARAVQCRYRVLNPDASVRAGLMDLAFLAFNVLRPRGRFGWGLSAGILGNGFALRGAVLQRVPWDADSIVEDLEYHLRLVSAGERVDFIDVATVYGEIPAGGAAAKVQRSRWEGGRMRMAKEWAPKLTAEIARGKWRLTEPLLDLLMLPLAYHVLLLSLALVVLPASFRVLAAAPLGMVLIYVLAACGLGQRPLRTVMALASVPFYLLWKFTTLAGVVSGSRRNAGWTRTARNHETGLRPAE
jgi:cellulose synthase/poly-beta-1,6-N-acetylglucosamine synthase-like glycosyltransferase